VQRALLIIAYVVVL